MKVKDIICQQDVHGSSEIKFKEPSFEPLYFNVEPLAA